MSFDAGAGFLAFLRATKQKAMEAEIVNTLITDLVADEILSGDGEGPIRVLFPGIGEGAQAADVAAAILQSTGRKIHVQGIEASEALGATARDRLSADPNLASTEIEIGDAFRPGETSVSEMDLALTSHLLYYAPSESAVVAFVTALVEGLGIGGVAVFLHEPPPPDSVAALRERYGSDVIPSPVPLIDAAAAEAAVPVSRVEYRSRLRYQRVEIPAVLDSADARGSAEADEAMKLIEWVLWRGLGDLRERAACSTRHSRTSTPGSTPRRTSSSGRSSSRRSRQRSWPRTPPTCRASSRASRGSGPGFPSSRLATSTLEGTKRPQGAAQLPGGSIVAAARRLPLGAAGDRAEGSAERQRDPRPATTASAATRLRRRSSGSRKRRGTGLIWGRCPEYESGT